MPRLIKSLIAATASIGALLAAGCASVPAHTAQEGAMAGRMGSDHQCMMMAKHGAAGDQARPMACKMDCNCPMMQKHGAADTPSAPSPAPPEEHQHTPDAPPAEH